MVNTKSNKKSEMKDERPRLELVGQDGNAFSILGLAKKAARKAEWPQEKAKAFFQEATSGDYYHLLQNLYKVF